MIFSGKAPVVGKTAQWIAAAVLPAILGLVGYWALSPGQSKEIPSAAFTQAAPVLMQRQVPSLSRNDLIRVASSEELITLLKKMGLWEIKAQAVVPPVIFANYPGNLQHLGVKTRKRMFLHTLLPVALIANAEVLRERAALQSVLNTIGKNPVDLDLADKSLARQRLLTSREMAFLRQLTKKYRTTRASELLVRVDTVPVSLVMAQGALESSWGGSRFANEGNNFFGVWTWGERGMAPSRRDADKNHKLAIYDSILESVRAYILTLNRHQSYTLFRTIRRQTKDSVALADGLLYYSERRDEYVSDITNIISYNRLRKYDRFKLTSTNQEI